jgi:hypothetical protein
VHPFLPQPRLQATRHLVILPSPSHFSRQPSLHPLSRQISRISPSPPHHPRSPPSHRLSRSLLLNSTPSHSQSSSSTPPLSRPALAHPLLPHPLHLPSQPTKTKMRKTTSSKHRRISRLALFSCQREVFFGSMSGRWAMVGSSMRRVRIFVPNLFVCLLDYPGDWADRGSLSHRRSSKHPNAHDPHSVLEARLRLPLLLLHLPNRPLHVRCRRRKGRDALACSFCSPPFWLSGLIASFSSRRCES